MSKFRDSVKILRYLSKEIKVYVVLMLFHTRAMIFFFFFQNIGHSIFLPIMLSIEEILWSPNSTFSWTNIMFPCFNNNNYRIRPNYHTVRLGFSNLQDTLICGQTCIYLLRIHYKKDQKRTYLMMTMRIFLASLQRHMLWVLIWIASTYTTYAFVKK